MFFKMSAEAYPDEWQKVPYFPNWPPLEMQYLMYEEYSDERLKYFAERSDFHKLTYRFAPDFMIPRCIIQSIIDSGR